MDSISIVYIPGAPLTYLTDEEVQGIFLGMKFWPNRFFGFYERHRDFLGHVEVLSFSIKCKLKGNTIHE